MRPVTCGRCQSSFDVSHLAPGSVFVCGSCGQQLRVPGAPAPAGRPARPTRAAPGRAARTAPPPAPAAPASRRHDSRGSGRRGSRRDAGPPAERSKLPLILGLAGGGVVALGLIIVLIVSLGSGSGPATAETPVANAPPAGPTAAEQIRALQKEIFFAQQKRDLARLKRIHDEAEGLFAAGTAKQAAQSALELDDSLAWAHEGVGQVKFDAAGLPEDVTYETPDWKKLLEARDQKWISPDRVDELEKAKTRLLAHVKRVEEDAHYRKICMIKANIRLHPVFRDYDYTTIEVRPYLIFIQQSKDPSVAKRLQERAEKKGRLFRCLYETFRKEYAERFQLPALESDVFDDDVVLKAWVFADRESFNRYHESIGQPMGDSVGAYYSPTDQWMIIPEGAARSESPPGQDMDVNVSFHEGTHQLIHHWTKRILEDETGEEVEWTDGRLDSRSHWFQEGIAEFFGTAVPDGDSWKLFQKNVYRIDPWRAIRQRKGREWTFDDMLKASNNMDLYRAGGYMPPLFYSQAWAFLYFLNHFENGKYKEKFLTYMGKELHGHSGYEVFKEVFGLEEVAGSQLEKDFMKYCDDLVGQGPGTGSGGDDPPVGVGGG